MAEKVRITHSVQPADLYKISHAVTRATEWKPALDRIVTLLRSTIIFDNLAVFISSPQTHSLEVVYARAVGRGRQSEAEIAWGEILAGRVADAQQRIVEEPDISMQTDRLDRPYLLGIPLNAELRFLGVLVLIRFGGPNYSSEDLQLCEFVANQIALLLERQELQQQFDALQRLHDQNQLQEDFISTITHELRNPLGFIKGYATTLLRADTTWDQATQQEFLKIIDQETDHLQELIENLLDSARLQSGQLDMKFQPVRLDAVMNDVTMRARLQHHDLVINLDIAQGLKPVQGNPRRLSQVFENLISNAVKYASGSEISIRIAQDESGSLITMQDFGQGISEQYLPYIFNRFFRIPDQQPTIHGTGLGLYICKQIIEAHAGNISASSIVGKGTTFYVQLPALKNTESASEGD